MSHFALLTLHLFAAIMFVGTVFFEVLILEGIRKPIGREIMRTLELAIARRARRLMPFVMLVLYVAGFSMAWQYRSALLHPFVSSFALLLWTKIVLAISVLAHFITAMTLIFLAKAMFYISW